jgi:murein DD-endopeptidase MepM/ murein hydrolase activator NlpD
MRFPLSFVPAQSWHQAPLKFRSNRASGTRKHAGCDLYAPIGTPVFAVADGTVKAFGPFYLGTFALTIDHGQFWIRYGEISNAVASGLGIGTRVTEGDKIGEVGDLDGLDLSMVHFEMFSGTASGPLTVKSNPPFMRRSDLIDPTPFLDQWAAQVGSASPGPGPGPVNPPPLKVPPTVRRGSTGPAVLAWQQRLLGQGFTVSSDGRFDETTDNATKAFQRDSELQDNGVVGPETYAAMIEAEKD